MGRLGQPQCLSCEASASAVARQAGFTRRNKRNTPKPPKPPKAPSVTQPAERGNHPPDDEALYRPDLDSDLTWGEVRTSQMLAIFDFLKAAESWETAAAIQKVGGDEYLVLLRRMVDEQGLEVRVRTRDGERQFRIA